MPCQDDGVPRRLPLLALGAAAAIPVGLLAAPSSAFAHGTTPLEPPTLSSLLFDWSLDPLVTCGLLLAAAAWLLIARRVAALHPGHPVPAARTAAFLGGLAAIAVALQSGIERYDTTLFSVHMIQHLLLMLVAAPLLALAAPVTQLLRAASPGVRGRWLLPVLHSTPVAVLGHPIVAWLALTVVLWFSHFSPLFDLALEDHGVHELEHGLYIASSLLFWWPVIGADPARRRMPYAARALYLLLQLPVNSFLGMAILFAPAALYHHYASLGSPYGITALADQQAAGGIMWLAGDVAFIVAVLAVVAAWMRHEERDAPAAERRADVQRAALTARADELARSRERPSG